jgi:hypothetical protein
MSKAFLNRYKEYLTSYCNVDTAYLNPVINMLNEVTQLTPTNVTSGNVLMKISSGIPPGLQPISSVSSTTINFDYTEKGVDVSRKYISLNYVSNALSHFQDTWNLYNIGTWNMISKEEAVNIAYTSAQSLTLKFGNSNGSTTEIKPDLTNSTYTATLSMGPKTGVNGLLYPFWYVEIYFQKPYYSDIGIQVGISADTKEVLYCQSLVVLGASPTDNSPASDNSNQAQPTATLQPNAEDNPTENNLTPTTTQTAGASKQASDQAIERISSDIELTYLIEICVGIIIAIVALAIVGIQIKRRQNDGTRNSPKQHL